MPHHLPSLILVVDDHRDSADGLAMLLSAEHRVITAYDARTAFRRIREDSPRIVITDLSLPDIDGTVLAQRIRATPESSVSMVIALTGHAVPDERCSNFDYVMRKPLDFDRLKQLLRTQTGATVQ